MMRYGIWGIVAVAILGAISAAIFLNSGVAVQTAAAKTQSIREFVDLQAKTRLPRTYIITMPYAARLDELKVEEGDAVSQVEVVCQLVQNDLENEVNEVQAVVDRLAQSIAESQDVSVESAVYRQAISSIEAATKLLPQMVQDYIGRKGLGTQVLVKQKDEAEARLRQALVRKQRGTMTSPVDGVVLSRAIVNEQYVTAGTELLTIGNVQEMEVEAEVLSAETVKINIGNDVEVYGTTLGMLPGEGILAKVSRVFPAGFTKVSSLGVEQQRVKVIIQLDDPSRQKLLDRNVGVGYQLRARIYTATADAAIVIPRASLFRGPENQWQVFVVDGRTARLKDVEVGLMNDDQVQITAGLSYPDPVIVAPDKSISDGTRVKPIGKAIRRIP